MHTAMAEVIFVIGRIALFMAFDMYRAMKLMTVILSNGHFRARSISCPLKARKQHADKHNQ